MTFQPAPKKICLVPLRIRVQWSDTTRPRNLSADVTIVDAHGNAAVNPQLRKPSVLVAFSLCNSTTRTTLSLSEKEREQIYINQVLASHISSPCVSM